MTFGELVVARKLASVDQVEDATRHHEELARMGVQKSLASVLQERGLLTLTQIQDLLDDLAAVTRDPDEQPIPGYEIEAKVGHGEMGTVYRARQIGLDRLVAIKVLGAQLAVQPEYIERFRTECQAAARLRHPAVVSALTAGEDGGFYYLVMEYVDGFTAQQMLASGHRFTERQVVDIGLQIVGALEAMHASALLHRDIKPSNIMIDPSGTAKLCDLGLAKDIGAARNVTRKGAVLGTPYYVAPEVIEGRTEPDIRCDIYSLAATLQALATGEPPLPGSEPREIMAASLAGSIRDPLSLNPMLSNALVIFLRQALSRNPGDRHATPAAMREALEAVKARVGPTLKVTERLQMTVTRIKGILRGKLWK